MNKILIITAPSGSGKTTIIKELLKAIPNITFSISACTRNPREGEINGKDYHFLTPEAFQEKIAADAFVEWEMVYEGKYYGTLKSELDRIWAENKLPLFDIDVKGAYNVKQMYGDQAVSIFIKAPSIEALAERLNNRGTETPETLKERVAKAEEELSYAPKFDHIVVNDDLTTAIAEVINIVNSIN